MARISTGTGDKGETSLFDLSRVGKDSVRVAAYGDVDELNAIFGLMVAVTRERGPNARLIAELTQLQQHMFLLGADLATPLEKEQANRVSDEEVGWVERLEDEIENALPPLKEFVLPGGTRLAALLHQSRTVARRAERNVVALGREQKVNPHALVYLNRLSDLLFLMARRENAAAGVKETKVEFRAPRRKKG